jgi:hypothetical protein
MPSKSFIGSATAVIARIGRVLSVPFGKRVADPATYTAHDPLWAGIDRKLEDAQFYLDEMARSLQPPERTPMTVVQQSTGAIIGTRWQESFYAHVDTFLAKARSIPEIIESCFGADRVLKQTGWFGRLTVDEQTRRKKFSKRFCKARGKFSKHHLTNERNTSEHRLGYSGVEGKVIGPFGEVHAASPVKRVPTAESRRFDNPADEPDLPLGWLHTPQPVQPRWDQFTINGKPLFSECREYLQLARDLRDQAHTLGQQVHGSDTVTPPPPA